mgnify:CR=1 FL=1
MFFKQNEYLVEKWKQLDGPNFTFYDTTDLIPLFKKSDIMFADTTSAIQEFLLQKKPVVTFKHTLKHDYLIQINHVLEGHALTMLLAQLFSHPLQQLNNESLFLAQR